MCSKRSAPLPDLCYTLLSCAAVTASLICPTTQEVHLPLARRLHETAAAAVHAVRSTGMPVAPGGRRGQNGQNLLISGSQQPHLHLTPITPAAAALAGHHCAEAERGRPLHASPLSLLVVDRTQGEPALSPFTLSGTGSTDAAPLLGAAIESESRTTLRQRRGSTDFAVGSRSRHGSQSGITAETPALPAAGAAGSMRDNNDDGAASASCGTAAAFAAGPGDLDASRITTGSGASLLGDATSVSAISHHGQRTVGVIADMIRPLPPSLQVPALVGAACHGESANIPRALPAAAPLVYSGPAASAAAFAAPITSWRDVTIFVIEDIDSVRPYFSTPIEPSIRRAMGAAAQCFVSTYGCKGVRTLALPELQVRFFNATPCYVVAPEPAIWCERTY